MAQRPKEHVRAAIVDAATAVFVDAGFEAATMAAIAARAGTSIGNLYKYFANKDQVFAAAFPPLLVAELCALLRRRVQALGIEREAHALGATHPYRLVSEEMLRFSFAHRAQILFLLRRSEGTPYAPFVEDLVETLARLARGYARRAYPRVTMIALRRRALIRIYRAFVGSMGSIVAEETTERGMRDATEQLVTYHLAGVRALFEAAEQEDRQEIG